MTADTKPIDISWEEIDPSIGKDRPVDLTSWEEVDRHLRQRVTKALNAAENHFAGTALGRLDALSAVPAFTRTAAALAKDPAKAFQIGTKYATGMIQAFFAAGARSVGGKLDGPIDAGKDKRFADATWTDNAGFWLLRQQYLLWEHALQALVGKAPVEENVRVKVGFLTQAIADAMAPTNTFLTNPAAMRRAVETGGQSV